MKIKEQWKTFLQDQIKVKQSRLGDSFKKDREIEQVMRSSLNLIIRKWL